MNNLSVKYTKNITQAVHNKLTLQVLDVKHFKESDVVIEFSDLYKYVENAIINIMLREHGHIVQALCGDVLNEINKTPFSLVDEDFDLYNFIRVKDCLIKALPDKFNSLKVSIESFHNTYKEVLVTLSHELPRFMSEHEIPSKSITVDIVSVFDINSIDFIFKFNPVYIYPRLQ